MAERYVVLGLATVRAGWFQEVARWATAAVVPIEFLKCVSAEEVRARFGSGRAFSALLVDGGLPTLDRDLVDTARAAGAAVLVVDDGRSRRDWAALGTHAVLPAMMDRATLLGALHDHAPAVRAPDVGPRHRPDGEDRSRPPRWKGRLLAVTGAGGTGTSTIAAGLAAGMAADPRHRGRVVLADLALDADQALLHHAGDVVPGLQELVEAHRAGTPGPDEVLGLTFEAPRGYHLLLGLRRHRDWAALRPQAVAASLDGLRHAFGVVVADIDPDLEGEAQCGSLDVEERNLLARATASRADLVLVTARAGVGGTHRLVRSVHDLAAHGVPAPRIVPVVNQAPRAPRARAEITAAVAELTTHLAGDEGPVAQVVFVPDRRRIEATVRDRALDVPFAAALARSATALLDRLAEDRSAQPGEPGPERIEPGSLGTWTEAG